MGVLGESKACAEYIPEEGQGDHANGLESPELFECRQEKGAHTGQMEEHPLK